MNTVQYVSRSHVSACCSAPVIGIIFPTEETVWEWKMVHVCAKCGRPCELKDKLRREA